MKCTSIEREGDNFIKILTLWWVVLSVWKNVLWGSLWERQLEMSVNLVDSLSLNFLDCRAEMCTHFINNNEQKALKLLPTWLEGRGNHPGAKTEKNFFLAWKLNFLDNNFLCRNQL